jgi:hypothetical protein
MWVSWKLGKYSITSRVEDFSIGGAFIASHEAMAVGARLDLHFLLPEGQIRVQAIVSNVREGRAMGVDSMGEREFDLS